MYKGNDLSQLIVWGHLYSQIGFCYDMITMINREMPKLDGLKPNLCVILSENGKL